MITRCLRIVFFAVAVVAVIAVTVWCSVTPEIVGNGDADSIWVAFTINDTLGNADDADSCWIVRYYNGRAFDSLRLTEEYEARDGLYAVPFRAAAGDSLGAYWVHVNAYGVDGRNPHATFAYTVVDGGPAGLSTELAGIKDLLVDTVDVARDETKVDYQSTTGPGAVPVWVHCLNEADSTSIQGVRLTVRLADGTTKHRAISDADGIAGMTLDNTDYDIFATANNFLFDLPAGTLTVDADSLRDTIWGEWFHPGDPGGPSLCRLYGWVHDFSGDVVAGAEVTIRLLGSSIRYDMSTISPYEQTAVSDTVGFWYLDVIPSKNLVPDTTKYELTIRQSSGAIARQHITVPDSAAWLVSW